MLDEIAKRNMGLCRLIGQQRRFQVLRLLCDREMSHEEICIALQKPMGVWKHLKAMVEAGLLIRTDITPRDIRYRANPQVLEDLSDSLQDMAIDAHEITYRSAQKGTPLGDRAEAELQQRVEASRQRLITLGERYGRKPGDIMPDVDDATRREMMATFGQEPAETANAETAEEHGPHVG
jgi:hypothetical protein